MFFNAIHSKTLLLVVFDEFENFNSVFLYFLDKPLRTVLIHLFTIFSSSTQRQATIKYLLDLGVKPRSPDSSKIYISTSNSFLLF